MELTHFVNVPISAKLYFNCHDLATVKNRQNNNNNNSVRKRVIKANHR